MSVSSIEMELPRTSSGSDFCCTEEELFNSFMEIVNDPELQSGDNPARTEEASSLVIANVPSDTNETDCLNGEQNKASLASSSSGLESQVDCENEEKRTENVSMVNSQEQAAGNSQLSETGLNSDLNNKSEISFSISVNEFAKEQFADNVNANVADDDDQKLAKDESLEILDSNGISQIDDMQATENNESQSSISPEKDSLNSMLSPTDNREVPTEPLVIDAASDQSLANQNEAYVKPANQTELQKIESDIEERIRKANEVCEELNAITQRLSQSSDELLDNYESEGTLDTRNDKIVNQGSAVILSQNNISDVDSHSKDNSNEESPNEVNTDEANTNEANVHKPETSASQTTEIDVTSKPSADSKRPSSLPKLIVTGQGASEVTPSPNGVSPATTTSPLGVSPTLIMHLNDERVDTKHSMSDSLDSSEGSQSGDTRSSGTPTEVQGPVDWEILNSALEHPDSEEDDGVYETRENYGGFGLMLDLESTEEESRFRSVSQSSTVSETEFQQEYKKQHSSGSLEQKNDGVLCSGYLFKLGGTGITPKNWRKRWCVLRQDRCLYYYKSTKDKIPCGIVVLANYIVSHSSEFNKKNCLKISKGGARTYFFSSESPPEMLRWMEALRKAAENTEEGMSFVIRKEIIHNVAIPALSIKKPDCHGYLTKQGGKTTRSWKRRYCVLKNGCLYYYREMADTTALGVAKLHGYTVRDLSVTGRRNGFRCVPPLSGMRTFTFVADNEYDKKRWIPCFEESIRANTST